MLQMRAVAVLVALVSITGAAWAADDPGAASRSFPPLAPAAATVPTAASTAPAPAAAPATPPPPPAFSPPPVATASAAPPPPLPPPPTAASVQPPPRPPRDWDLGAGIGIGDATLGSLGGGFLLTNTPSYRASLERRLGALTWLGVTGLFDYDAGTQPVYTNTVLPARQRIDYSTNTIAGLLGVRQVVYRDVVELSLYGAFGYQRARIGGDTLLPGESLSGPAAPGSFVHAWRISTGLSLERELIESLAVRLSAELGNLMRSRTVLVNSGNVPRSDSKDDRIQLHIAPALDLRFCF